MNTQLLITNIGHIISIIITLSLIILVISRGHKKQINIVFFLLGIATIIWELSYITGVNISDPLVSRTAFMWNMASLFIVILNAHFALLITGRYQVQKKILGLIYLLGIGLVIFFATSPDLFLLPSEPKLYFTNFFVQGKYYFIGDIFFFGVLIYFLYHLLSAFKQGDFDMRNRLKYLIVSMLIAYGIGSVPLFLLYGVEINPLVSALFGLYSIPMAYSIVEYKLIDINIVAKRAFWYAIGVTIVAILIVLISSANEAIITNFPNFPRWILPGLSGMIAVSSAIIVWKKIRETDILKDEFINIIMHRFRTPITYIKWSVEMLKTLSTNEEQKKELDNIEEENTVLVGLTDTLVNLANIGGNEKSYALTEENLAEIIKKVINKKKVRINAKKITIDTEFENNLPPVNVDLKRIEFVIETIIDNAITYTPDEGNIKLSIKLDDKKLIFSVKDNGVGISKKDLPRIFIKFFRGDGVKIDTEGMGIGLFISKDIMRRHGGTISVESDGLGKGAKFSIDLPLKA